MAAIAFSFANNAPYLARGPSTYRVPKSMYKASRQSLVASLRTETHGTSMEGLVLLKGGLSGNRNDTDHELLFRQESYFAFLFGVDEPDFWGAIDVVTGETILFMPRLPEEYAVWMGEIQKPPFFVEKYEVDTVMYVDELEAYLEGRLKAEPGIQFHVMEGVNSDSGADIKDCLPAAPAVPKGGTLNNKTLFGALAQCRVVKSDQELDLMRYC